MCFSRPESKFKILVFHMFDHEKMFYVFHIFAVAKECGNGCESAFLNNSLLAGLVSAGSMKNVQWKDLPRE